MNIMSREFVGFRFVQKKKEEEEDLSNIVGKLEIEHRLSYTYFGIHDFKQ